jgi:hypothetical protein
MTAPRSRDRGRTRDDTRPVAAYTTGAPPAADTPHRRCACGGAYRDTDDSRAAHRAVFGHRPITPAAKDN